MWLSPKMARHRVILKEAQLAADLFLITAGRNFGWDIGWRAGALGQTLGGLVLAGRLAGKGPCKSNQLPLRLEGDFGLQAVDPATRVVSAVRTGSEGAVAWLRTWRTSAISRSLVAQDNNVGHKLGGKARQRRSLIGVRPSLPWSGIHDEADSGRSPHTNMSLVPSLGGQNAGRSGMGRPLQVQLRPVECACPGQGLSR